MSQVRVTYDVRHPETHLVRVTMHFPASTPDEWVLRMPAWVPGSYKIRDYGRHVQDVKASVAGKDIAVAQPTKDAWVFGTGGKSLDVTYDVYCRELTVDTSHVTSDHAHIFPATVTMYDEASRDLPHSVTVLAPKGWRTFSGLESAGWTGKLEDAEDYDHLIDCPIEIGPSGDYHVGTFVAAGKKHRMVTWKAPGGVDWKRIERDVAAVCKETIKMWGEAPYDHYTFLSHVAAEHGGGLEHRNSTVLGVDPNHLLLDEKIQNNFLPLVAHEFFHTWNVKRVLPARFQPYDLQQETYTDLLWLFEGFTSYYELPILHRAKVVTAASWGKLAGEMLEWYEKALGRKRTSVAKASRLTWTLLYQPHEHNINRNVSYYTKGLWVGLCMDAHLRHNGVKDGLDVVMRHMWKKHGKTGTGVHEEAFPDLVEQATGLDVKRLYHRWVEGTEELPIDSSLRILGWDVRRDAKDPKKTKGLGIQFKGSSATIERIPEDVAAHKVLQPDDEIVAAAGYKWKPERFADWAAERKAGEAVELAIFREGRLRTVSVPLIDLPKDKINISHRKGDAAATRRRKAWLGEGKPDAKKAKKAPSKADA